MGEKPILVLGATGSTGRRVAALLGERGYPVRAASRRGRVRFDWADPSTWEGAVDGAGAMYLMAPDGVPIAPEFVELAVRRGVRRIVLLSSRAIEEMGDERLLAAERTVKGCGVDWTVLRCDWFDQNFDEGFLVESVRAGRIVLPLDGVRQAFVDADDIAAVAVAALTGDGHAGRVYEVTGPEALSFGEAAEVIGRVVGYPVRYDSDPEAFVRDQVAAGLPREGAEAAVGAFEALVAMGDGVPGDDVLRVTGRAPKPFSDYAVRAAPAWA
ncbi:NmrA family NAD(P)-binding protein [Nocardiopsis sp. EMB25]|uniref:NmrA family NAD(P)-binding protein n=1 Tax=Nocardiopsis sp. EMB25 TaxID=2835867 RepID=UPI002284A549|nr:NAD(P)H-binding protein [Nocardiopsis sp. EMB25]MCY9783690.1 NmrA family NAD(P)-binding protein [Nocardiopsis sp. EMB25]